MPTIHPVTLEQMPHLQVYGWGRTKDESVILRLKEHSPRYYVAPDESDEFMIHYPSHMPAVYDYELITVVGQPNLRYLVCNFYRNPPLDPYSTIKFHSDYNTRPELTACIFLNNVSNYYILDYTGVVFKPIVQWAKEDFYIVAPRCTVTNLNLDVAINVHNRDLSFQAAGFITPIHINRLTNSKLHLLYYEPEASTVLSTIRQGNIITFTLGTAGGTDHTPLIDKCDISVIYDFKTFRGLITLDGVGVHYAYNSNVKMVVRNPRMSNNTTTGVYGLSCFNAKNCNVIVSVPIASSRFLNTNMDVWRTRISGTAMIAGNENSTAITNGVKGIDLAPPFIDNGSYVYPPPSGWTHQITTGVYY